MEQIEKILQIIEENISFSPFQIRIFIGTCTAMFIMVVLQHLGIQSPLRLQKLISPITKKTDIFMTIRQKLDGKPTQYKLHGQSSLIQSTYAASDYDSANSYAVIDFDSGNVLAQKDISKKISIASLTKLMTAVVALDLTSPDEVFTVTPTAANMPPTKLGLTPGEKLTLYELLHGALMTSANDAAEEIKDGINQKYNSDIFVRAMNEKAQFLGLKNSNFTNPQGLDWGDNYSSVEDLAILTNYAFTNYPLISEIVQKDFQHFAANENHPQMDLNNWNGLLDVYPDTKGVKIGNTRAAGYTTIALSNRGGKRILAVVLGAPGILQRDLWASELLDLGYQKTLNLDPINITESQLKEKYNSWQYWN